MKQLKGAFPYRSSEASPQNGWVDRREYLIRVHPSNNVIDKLAAEGLKGKEAQLKKKGIKVIDKTG